MEPPSPPHPIQGRLLGSSRSHGDSRPRRPGTAGRGWLGGPCRCGLRRAARSPPEPGRRGKLTLAAAGRDAGCIRWTGERARLQGPTTRLRESPPAARVALGSPSSPAPPAPRRARPFRPHHARTWAGPSAAAGRMTLEGSYLRSGRRCGCSPGSRGGGRGSAPPAARTRARSPRRSAPGAIAGVPGLRFRSPPPTCDHSRRARGCAHRPTAGRAGAAGPRALPGVPPPAPGIPARPPVRRPPPRGAGREAPPSAGAPETEPERRLPGAVRTAGRPMARTSAPPPAPAGTRPDPTVACGRRVGRAASKAPAGEGRDGNGGNPRTPRISKYVKPVGPPASCSARNRRRGRSHRLPSGDRGTAPNPLAFP